MGVGFSGKKQDQWVGMERGLQGTLKQDRPPGLGSDDQASCRVPPLSEGVCPICESGEDTAVLGQILPVRGLCRHQCVQHPLTGFPPWSLPAYVLGWVPGCS